jgi:hypothetical protein
MSPFEARREKRLAPQGDGFRCNRASFATRHGRASPGHPRFVVAILSRRGWPE